MSITPSKICSLVEDELARLDDQRALRHIRSLLVEPTAVMREWDYGAEGEAYPCWAVLDHIRSNTGIAYCESGFGPRSPWGLVKLSGSSHMSIGMDSGWFVSFLDAYFESMAAIELPIWRVFKQGGGAYPSVPITEESDWDSTWKRVHEFREADKSGGYYCSQSVYERPDET
jgi:hypothetical protein